MSANVFKSPLARRDLVDLADYLAETAGLVTADRFLDAVEKALTQIAGMPLMGAPWESPHPRLQGIRTWLVPKFRRYLIFYRPINDGVEVLRILHGARDANALLDDEPD